MLHCSLVLVSTDSDVVTISTAICQGKIAADIRNHHVTTDWWCPALWLQGCWMLTHSHVVMESASHQSNSSTETHFLGLAEKQPSKHGNHTSVYEKKNNWRIPSKLHCWKARERKIEMTGSETSLLVQFSSSGVWVVSFPMCWSNVIIFPLTSIVRYHKMEFLSITWTVWKMFLAVLQGVC